MSAKIEGTIRVSGLVEGPMPLNEQVGAKLEAWAGRKLGGRVGVSIQVDAGHFSVLPDDGVVRCGGDRMEEGIGDSLREMLEILPALERGKVFSTLRSVEYRPGEEVRVIYGVGSDGRVQMHREVVEAVTVAAEKPLAPKEMAMRVGMGLLVAGVVLGIGSFFVDYRAVWSKLVHRADGKTVTVSAEGYGAYFGVEVKGLSAGGDELVLVVRRREGYPMDDGAVERGFEEVRGMERVAAGTQVANTQAATTAATQVAGTQVASTQGAGTQVGATSGPATTRMAERGARVYAWQKRRVLEAVATGYVRVEMFDGAGKYMGGGMVRIAGLREAEAVEVKVGLPVDGGRRVIVPSRVVVTY